MKTTFFTVLLLAVLIGGNIEYVKLFFENGDLRSEGWVRGDEKINYWFYYYSNGKVEAKGEYQNNKKDNYWFYYYETGLPKKEGHYKNGMATSWWRYYHGDSVMSIELKNGKKEGLAIYKVNGNPVKAEYYKNDKRTHEWFSLKEFRKDKSDLETIYFNF